MEFQSALPVPWAADGSKAFGYLWAAVSQRLAVRKPFLLPSSQPFHQRYLKPTLIRARYRSEGSAASMTNSRINF